MIGRLIHVLVSVIRSNPLPLFALTVAHHQEGSTPNIKRTCDVTYTQLGIALGFFIVEFIICLKVSPSHLVLFDSNSKRSPPNSSSPLTLTPTPYPVQPWRHANASPPHWVPHVVLCRNLWGPGPHVSSVDPVDGGHDALCQLKMVDGQGGA